MIICSTEIEESPLVSVVVCSYNRQEYISKTIDSILNQKRNFKIEIIIGDDASIDNTREILVNYQKKYPTIFKLIFHEENMGLGKNWANLMKHVRGTYVALCDDDDFWHCNEKLQMQVEILESNSEIGLIYTNFRTKKIHKRKYYEVETENRSSKNVFLDLFTGNFMILVSSVLFRNSLIEKYVNLDDYIKFDFPIQDWETWMLIAKYTTFYHLPISTVTYHFTLNSVTRFDNLEKLKIKCEREKLMYKYICDKFPDDLVFDEQHYDKHVKRLLFNFAFNTNDYKLAKDYSNVLAKNDLRYFFIKNNIFFYLFQITRKIRNFIYH